MSQGPWGVFLEVHDKMAGIDREHELDLALAKRSPEGSIISPILLFVVIWSTNLGTAHFHVAATVMGLLTTTGMARFFFVRNSLKGDFPKREVFLKVFRGLTAGMALSWGTVSGYTITVDSYHWTALFTFLVAAGICAGATASLMPDLVSQRMYLVLCMLPPAIASLSVSNHAMFLVVILGIAFLAGQAHRQNAWLKATIESQIKLEERTRELEIAKVNAEAAVDARSVFLATMSHEIRTPLNGVIGMTGLLQETPLNREQQEYTATIRRSGETLMAIINDILDFSKLEAEMMDLEHVEFELRPTLEDVVDLLYYQANEKDLHLHLMVDHRLPANLMGDPTRLRQIFLNLLSNAVKFTQEGTVLLKATPGETENEILFEVVDTGIGIPPSRFHRLFKEFSQVDTSTSRKFGGTGLGLVICERLVSAMGGSIGAKSQPGVGSTFWVRLPLEAASRPPGDVPGLSLEDVKVALVTHHEAARQALAELLKASGATLLAQDEETGSKLLETADVVLLDYTELNGQSAHSLPKTLNSLGEKTPTVLLKPAFKPLPDEKNISRRVSATLAAPVRQHSLIETVQLVLGKLRDKTVGEPPVSRPESEQGHLRILVVEDNQVNQKLLARLVERNGYRCDIVANGAEAVKAVQALPYHLVLMDCYMPVMDGLDATREIRKTHSELELPIVAVTANASVKDRDSCFAAGMNDYITKPVRPAQFQNLLSKHLGFGTE